MSHSKYESKQYMYRHVLNGGAITCMVHQGQIILSPYIDQLGIGVWLITDEKEGKYKRIQLFASKSKKDIELAVTIFYHIANRNTYEFYNQKTAKGNRGDFDIIETSGVALDEPARKPVPKTVERYYNEHILQGVPDGKAWALAWSRFCKYSYPGSKRCHKKASEYLTRR